MGAATIAGTFDRMVEWTRDNIAGRIELKVPPEDGDVESYAYETAHPQVFENFVPERDCAPDGRRYPFVTVQLLDVTDSLRGRTLRFRLAVGIWAPGTFDDGELDKSMCGWRELDNVLDEVSSALQAADTVAGCRLDMERGVSLGPYRSGDEVMVTYPYYVGAAEFDLASGTPAPAARFSGLL